jgi:hypothetical protein
VLQEATVRSVLQLAQGESPAVSAAAALAVLEFAVLRSARTQVRTFGTVAQYTVQCCAG